MKAKILKRGRGLLWGVALSLLAVFALYPAAAFGKQTDDSDDGIVGCSTSTSEAYEGNFEADDFEFTNVDIDPDTGNIILNTGNQAIDPNEIKIPFEQEVWATFLYEGALYVSDFGWMLYEDAVDDSGNFKGWNSIASSKKHPVFINIYDDDETSTEWGGGNGVLDSNYGNGSFPTTNETQLAQYNDGSGVFFEVDKDGSVTPKDMKKSLGRFAGGTELVFFLTADTGYDTEDPSKVFYTKTSWNSDKYTACTPPDGSDQWISESEGTFNKLYDLGTPLGSESGCNVDGNWLADLAFTRMRIYFGISLSGTYELRIKDNTTGGFPHVIVGAPADDPNQWILGWEDKKGNDSTDADHNDMVFRIERKTGGTAELKAANAITPSDESSYYTSVSIEVYDYIPNTGVCQGQTDIKYYISIDGGDTWEEVRDWTVVKESDADKNLLGEVTDWEPGTPEYTYRSARIDFAALGRSGNQLLWKSELISNNEACVPRIIDVALQGSVATNAIFSRSSPIVQTNVVYSGSYETPAVDWPTDERWLRGHLTATRVYDPAAPTETNELFLWDAGAKLAEVSPASRTIYFPKLQFGEVTSDAPEFIDGQRGDGSTLTFSGTLAKPAGAIIQAGSLVITDEDGREVFQDVHTDEMVGDWGGTGWVNRFTGEFTITYAEGRAPRLNKKIKAWYTYYTSEGMQEFVPANVDTEWLELDDSDALYGEEYQDHDFNEDKAVDDGDRTWLVNWTRGYKDGSSTPKAWLLGAIDHSAPAIAVAPGRPDWYYTLDEEDPLRTSFDEFRETHKNRQTVVYVGARDGMLHAFDGGHFRWGDNPDTPEIQEYRGYFEWDGNSDVADQAYTYGTGAELWAFIPTNMLARLKYHLVSGGDPAYVDASPAVADIYANGQWKTVLVSAQGNGGDTIFCLDVTLPTSPNFLWEFSDPDLFRSSSSPALAQIAKVRNGNKATWTAFFVSGETTNCNNDIYCYPSVYMIDIADGSLVARVFLDSGPEDSKNGTPSGQPAIVDIDSNGFADRFYVGTDKGYLYRVNIPDDGSTAIEEDTLVDCVVNTSLTTTDGEIVSSAYQSIYASPTVVVENGVAKIFFGTGDSPYDANDGSEVTNYYFFGYEDKSGKGECGDVDLTWFMELPAGEKVFASAFAAAGQIYFGTTTAATEDPCEGYFATADSNGGNLYALDQDQSGAVDPSGGGVTVIDTGNLSVTPVVDDQHIYYKTPTSAASSLTGGAVKSIGSGQYNNAPLMKGTPQTAQSWWREVIPD